MTTEQDNCRRTRDECGRVRSSERGTLGFDVPTYFTAPPIVKYSPFNRTSCFLANQEVYWQVESKNFGFGGIEKMNFINSMVCMAKRSPQKLVTKPNTATLKI